MFKGMKSREVNKDQYLMNSYFTNINMCINSIFRQGSYITVQKQ